MILPTKGVTPHRSLVSVGADVLALLTEPKTVSRLWHEMKVANERTLEITFDWFVLALDFLFMTGAIQHSQGRVRRSKDEADS